MGGITNPYQCRSLRSLPSSRAMLCYTVRRTSGANEVSGAVNYIDTNTYQYQTSIYCFALLRMVCNKLICVNKHTRKNICHAFRQLSAS